MGEIGEKSVRPSTVLSEMYAQPWEGLAHTVMINCDAFGVPFTKHGQILQVQYVQILGENN